MEAYEQIIRLSSSRESLSEKMRRLTPSGVKVPRLDYEGELSELRRWLRRLLLNEPPPRNLAGIWLGLFHPVGPNREMLTDMNFSGTESFELDDVEKDWATGPRYFPEGRYAGSGVLATLQVCSNDSGVDLQYMCLGYLAFVSGPLLDSVCDLLPDGLGVAVGWDAGDALYLGFSHQAGFLHRDPDEVVKEMQDAFADREAWWALPNDDPAPREVHKIQAWAERRREAWLRFREQRAKERRARSEE